MKVQADTKRSERNFILEDWVYLKLQSYVQSSVASRANHKLAFRYFGSFQVEQKLGAVAYKLKLPPTCGIHPVIHVSQLKKALAPSEEAQQELPEPEVDRVLDRVLRHRLHRAGSASGTQVLVQWSGSSPANDTWEDLIELQNRFPHARVWGQVGVEEVGNITEQEGAPDGEQEDVCCRQGDRISRPMDRYPASDWVL